jgi:hypothetical protein
MVTGDDHALSRSTKKTYFRLGLGHFFTPSGVHLATVAPLLKKIQHGFLLYGLLAVSSIILPGLLALARVAWLKFMPGLGKTLSGFSLIMITEGILYSWQIAPLSWVCSWLFLGLTYFSPKRTMLAWYLLGQMLLVWVFHQGFSLFTLPASVLFGLPLALIFPLILIASLIPWTTAHGWLLNVLTSLHEMILQFDTLHTTIPAFHLHAGHLLLGATVLCVPGTHKSKIVGLILLGLASPCGEWQRGTSSVVRWEIVPAPQAKIVSTHQTKGHISSRWSDGTSCRHQLVQGIWRENCRARRPGKVAIRTKKLSSER